MSDLAAAAEAALEAAQADLDRNPEGPGEQLNYETRLAEWHALEAALFDEPVLETGGQ